MFLLSFCLKIDDNFSNFLLQRGQRRTLQDLGIYSTPQQEPELLSLDFWESYDPDEVCNTGFGLIGFDPFHMKPVCFLCGSAGKKRVSLSHIHVVLFV